MEDNGRELDPFPVNTPPVKNGYQSSKELTIMLIGSVGKMRSFKISRKLILCLSLFFFIYIAISIVLFYLYFDLFTARKDQSNEIHNLKAELGEKTRILEQKELYVKGLEDFYYAAQKRAEEKTDAEITPNKTPESKSTKATSNSEKKSKDPAKKSIEEKADTGATGKSPEQMSQTVKAPAEEKNQKSAVNEIQERAETAITPEPITSETNLSGETEKPASDLIEGADAYIEVRDIKFQRTDARLTLEFRLVNMLADEKSAEGYIHILVMDKDKECPPEWNSAYNKLTDGFPIDFKHGQQFIIQKFRPYQRQYEIIPDSELPSFIRILVYDRSGQKILEKEFPVTDESENVPS